MRIVELRAENVKRLRAVTIRPRPEGGVLVIGGENGAGKSAALDAIEMALGGGASTPAEPVRRGEKEARIVLETDEFTVFRRYTAEGKDSLEIHVKGKGKVSSPQALLDSVYSRLSFDALDFVRISGKEQAELLRQITGLDFADLDAARKAAFDERTLVNRKEKELAGAVARMLAPPPGTPDEEVALKERLDALEDARLKNRARAEAMQRVVDLGKERERALARWMEATRLAEEAEAAHVQVVANQEVAREEAKNAAAEDEEPLRKAVEDVEKINAAVRQKQARAAAEEDLRAVRAEVGKFTAAIHAADQDRAIRLATAKFPVAGLGISEDGATVTFGGLPFAQASQAEALKVSCAIGAALNPKLRFLLIRDGSLLDLGNLAALDEWAREKKIDVLLERVGDGPEVSVVIEDGAVREVRR
jgi:DNA repair exonuclease SbcCD ATPase subunit